MVFGLILLKYDLNFCLLSVFSRFLHYVVISFVGGGLLPQPSTGRLPFLTLLMNIHLCFLYIYRERIILNK